MKNTTLLLNPSSKGGKGKKNWKHFLGKGCQEIITKNGQHIVQCAIIAENETIVAVGGDGTINLTINGIMNSEKKKTLGVLYSGTSPDFCKFHNIPIDPKESIQVLKRNNRKNVDVMKVTYSKDNTVAYFASSCNIGLGGQMADIANKIRRFTGDILGTLIAALITIFNAKPFKAQINIDGEEFQFNDVYHIMTIKNNYIASGLYLDIDVKPDDGRLCILVIKSPLLKTLFGLYSGKVPEGAFFKYGKKAYIELAHPKNIEFDGDSHGETPVIIECLERALELIK